MSSQTPPTLQELARLSLMRDEALFISALKDLPLVHFPPLFKEVFNQTRTEILRVMVQEWPFPCLPLGALMKDWKTPDWRLHTILGAIDMVLLQKVHPRRYKLELLDLRTLDSDFWDTWYGATAMGWSSWRRSETRAAACRSRTGLKWPFKVVIDLDLTTNLSRLTTYIFEWVDQRKASVHLYCCQLKIREPSFPDRRKILQMFYLYYTQELHLRSVSFPCSLINFSPYMGCMRRLRKLFLTEIWENDFMIVKMRQKIITQFTLEFLNMECLQELHVNTVPFLEGHLAEML
ncbi:preferentially expressed antigen in melanoma-like protein 1, partial [Nannospalax galili]|uniref:preferentially expressed antigen in melanoma-like protein 1 n=1 Tax=Nannospalax galili TaxID=1026970 RepID=UPI00081A0A49